MAKATTSIFSSLLAALDVPHTRMYSDERFATMPFKSLFGLTRLLKEYGIDSQGMMLTDRSQIAAMDVPFLAQTQQSFVVVTDVQSGDVAYVDDEGTSHKSSLSDFNNEWTGVVLAAYPCAGCCEPKVCEHRITERGLVVMDRLFYICAAFLIIAGVIVGHTYRSFPSMAAIVISLAGVFVCYLLLLKQMGVKSHAADSVCAVVQAGGCDHVLSQSASKFMGLFGWSELGASYFGVNLLVMLVAPHYEPWIAMINVFCLPFSFWSVWYQHFRAHAWCTLCLTVQALLWLTFFSQLPSAWWHEVSLISWPTVILGAVYLFALLSVNRIMKRLTPKNPDLLQ